MYKVTLKLNNKEFIAEDEVLAEALGKLEKPGIIKTTGVLIVEKDGKRHERILNVLKIKILYTNEVYREISAKNLEHFLK